MPSTVRPSQKQARYQAQLRRKQREEQISQLAQEADDILTEMAEVFLLTSLLMAGLLTGIFACHMLVADCLAPDQDWVFTHEYETEPSEVPRLIERLKGHDKYKRDAALDLLMTWFDENGGWIHDYIDIIRREGNEDEWGFFASDKIENDDILLALPQHLLLNAHVALHSLVKHHNILQDRSKYGNAITTRRVMSTLGFQDDPPDPVLSVLSNKPGKDGNQHKMQEAVLALYLYLHHNNTEHFFFPYFASLPTGCQMSICWSQERLESIFLSPEVAEIVEERHLFEDVAIRLGLNETDFLEWVSIVKSKYWKDPSMADAPTLLPVADLLKHAPNSQETLISFSSDDFEGCSLSHEGEDIQIGEEIYAGYGWFGNEVLVREYGITIPNNRADTCKELLSHLKPSFVEANIVLPKGVRCDIFS